MNGQQLSFKEKQSIVEKFIVSVDPYAEREPLKFDLRSYSRYVRENNIPLREITEEIMQKFAL